MLSKKEIVGDVQKHAGDQLPQSHVLVRGNSHENEIPLVRFRGHRLWTAIAAIGGLKMLKRMVPMHTDIFVDILDEVVGARRATRHLLTELSILGKSSQGTNHESSVHLRA
jgi:hypothetical protein